MSARHWRDHNHQNTAPSTMPGISAHQRRSRRGREKRFRPEQDAAGITAAATPPLGIVDDPVRIALLAMETLGPASMRASFTGTEVCVSAPDDSVAEIFRAVLAETGRRRSTDRLIRVVVE